MRAAGHDEGVRAEHAVVREHLRSRTGQRESARRGAQTDLVREREEIGTELVGEPRRARSVQEVLRQRRTVVRGDPLGAEHHDPSVVPPLTQRRDRLGRRETCSDDEHVTWWSGTGVVAVVVVGPGGHLATVVSRREARARW